MLEATRLHASQSGYETGSYLTCPPALPAEEVDELLELLLALEPPL